MGIFNTKSTEERARELVKNKITYSSFAKVVIKHSQQYGVIRLAVIYQMYEKGYELIGVEAYESSVSFYFKLIKSKY